MMKLYKQPKELIYLKHTGEWGPDGWIEERAKATVIGEEELLYITHTWIEPCWKWVDGKEIEYTREASTGIHKSRVIGFINQQLRLFD